MEKQKTIQEATTQELESAAFQKRRMADMYSAEAQKLIKEYNTLEAEITKREQALAQAQQAKVSLPTATPEKEKGAN